MFLNSLYLLYFSSSALFGIVFTVCIVSCRPDSRAGRTLELCEREEHGQDPNSSAYTPSTLSYSTNMQSRLSFSIPLTSTPAALASSPTLPPYNKKTKSLIDGLSRFFTPSPLGRRIRADATTSSEPHRSNKRTYRKRLCDPHSISVVTSTSQRITALCSALSTPCSLSGHSPTSLNPGQSDSPQSSSSQSSGPSLSSLASSSQLKGLFDGLSHIYATQGQSRQKGLPSYAPPKRGQCTRGTSSSLTTPLQLHGNKPIEGFSSKLASVSCSDSGWQPKRGRPFKTALHFKRAPFLKKHRLLGRFRFGAAPQRGSPTPGRSSLAHGRNHGAWSDQNHGKQVVLANRVLRHFFKCKNPLCLFFEVCVLFFLTEVSKVS